MKIRPVIFSASDEFGDDVGDAVGEDVRDDVGNEFHSASPE